MSVEFEQGNYGRFHIIVDDPGQPGSHIRFTYLLGEEGGTYLGQSPYINGAKPSDLSERILVEETPVHRTTINNFRLTMEKLRMSQLTEGLPTSDEPLTIWQRR